MKQTPQSPGMGLHLYLEGTLQGVGFRPFIYRLATELNLKGWIRNSPAGVEIEVEGVSSQLQAFLDRLPREIPIHAHLEDLHWDWTDPVGHTHFQILPSRPGTTSAGILPDLATCPQCLQELWDPKDRRYRYPFITCTHCGPRFSIMTALPYDRIHTTLSHFPLCPRCQQEYEDPLDRRFHAQPIACPECGPHLELWDRQGAVIARGDLALLGAVDRIRQGEILALKGLGGFQLLVDARSEAGIQRLRQRKRRPEKPFALLYPSLEFARYHCQISCAAAEVLLSATAPILLVSRRQDPQQSQDLPQELVAPDRAQWGVMLPYTPLHHLVMADLSIPVVATSGNRSGEPLCYQNLAALRRLGQIADSFLVHNRAIAHPVDDSVVHILLGRPQVLRSARGFAPQTYPSEGGLPLLAVGAQQKSTVALDTGRVILLSPHLGDLDTLTAVTHFEQTLADLQTLYQTQPVSLVLDLHPDYRSSQWGRRQQLPITTVPHHLAHVLAVMWEHHLRGDPPVLGVAWDGTGLGPDGTLWGGEFLRVDRQRWQRVAYIRPFPLPGGEKAIYEPRRAALGLLYSFWGEAVWDSQTPLLDLFTSEEKPLLAALLRQQLNTPLTSSVGRLFDAVAALLCQHPRISYDAQAALTLEDLARQAPPSAPPYPFRLTSQIPIEIDVGPMIEALLSDQARGSPLPLLAARFHLTLVQILVQVANRLQIPQVILSGGCFQNRILSEMAIHQLRAAHLNPVWAERIPANDGGIALGQVQAARHPLQPETARCV